MHACTHTHANTHSYKIFIANVDDTDLLVLAGRRDIGSIVVPRDGVYDVCVEVCNTNQSFTRLCVPHDDGIVVASRQENTGCTGVPLDMSNL